MTQLVYLDNAATTFPKPEVVYTTADTFYRSAGANAGRGQNPLAQQAAQLVAKVRSKVAAWLGVASPDQVIFAPSATIALNQAILGTTLKLGDTIYVSPFEHNSILRPVEYLKQKHGAEVRLLPADPLSLEIQLDRTETQFQAKPPTLLALSQVSNVCGLLLPVIELAKLARKANPEAVIIIDGAQGAGLYPLPLSDNLIDYFIFSGHKSLYGPYGASGMVLASNRRPAPILFGGTGTESERVIMPDEAPTAYEPGSMNVWALAGLGAAVDWIMATGREAITEHTHKLVNMLKEELQIFPGVRVYVPRLGQQTSIVSFSYPAASPQALEGFLGAAGIAVRSGLHCAPWCHRFLGTLESGGTVRISPGYFNTSSDILKLISALQPILTA